MTAPPPRDLRKAIRAHDRLVAMIDDPECAGDLLLVGVALLALVDLKRRDLRHLSNIEQLVRVNTYEGRWAKGAILDDARTYRSPAYHWADPCEAPMIRRAGYCGVTRGGSYVMLRDYDTGELRRIVHCSRHRDWARDLERVNLAEAPDPTAPRGGAPLPAANHGGVLARHFPEIDWPDYWRKLNPRWVEHPEGEPRPEPRFRLLVGDDDGSDSERPALALVPAGRNT